MWTTGRRGDEGRGQGRGALERGEARARDAGTRVIGNRLSRASRDGAGEVDGHRASGTRASSETDARGEQERSVGTGRTVRVEPRDCLRDDARNTSAPIPTRFPEGCAEHRHRPRVQRRAGRHCSGARLGPESRPPRKTLRGKDASRIWTRGGSVFQGRPRENAMVEWKSASRSVRDGVALRVRLRAYRRGPPPRAALAPPSTPRSPSPRRRRRPADPPRVRCGAVPRRGVSRDGRTSRRRAVCGDRRLEKRLAVQPRRGDGRGSGARRVLGDASVRRARDGGVARVARAAESRVRMEDVLAVVAADFAQRMAPDRVSNPHGEHAEDFWEIVGEVPEGTRRGDE